MTYARGGFAQRTQSLGAFGLTRLTPPSSASSARTQRQRHFAYVVFPVALLLLAGCKKDKDKTPQSQRFTVTVENVSTPDLVNTVRAGGTVPLSPGVFTVSAGANPMFTSGLPADEGTERIAEDGFPESKLAAVKANRAVESGSFDSPGGPDSGPAIFASEKSTFTFEAQPGNQLQLARTFVQSNDWFSSFGNGGLPLFNGTTPGTGDVSSSLVVYDAGTEAGTPPGTDQKPAQTPTEVNKGAADSVNRVETAAQRRPDYTVPPVTSVIKITITAQ